MERRARATVEVPSPEAFQDWLLHPVTEALRLGMERWRIGLMEQWEAKVFQDDLNPTATAVYNAAALGELDLLKRLRELTYEQFTAMLEVDDEQAI